MSHYALRPATVDDASAIAALHAARISEGFLVTLGPRFLQRLYRSMVLSRAAFVLVAAEGPCVRGLIAVAEDTRRFYREFLTRQAVFAVSTATPAVVRRPRHVWETLRYGTRADASLPKAEILAVAVDVGMQGRGLGTRLVVAAVDELDRRGVSSARVVTADDNLSAHRMYERAGFRHSGYTEVHRSARQEVMVWP